MRSLSPLVVRLVPSLVLVAITATACTPHDAEVDGSVHVWLAENSSATLAEEAVGIADATLIDCFNEGEDILEESSCSVDVDADGLPLAFADETFAYIVPDSYEGPWGWLLEDVFYLKESKLDPWRTEAVLTSEGDFQLTVHQKIGKSGEDFRFAFAIDPVFQPTQCIQEGQTCYTVEGEPQDEDGDGWYDINDPDCLFGGYEQGFSSIAPPELLSCEGLCDCNDGYDNDGDGDIDADDIDCVNGFDDNESDDLSCEDFQDNDGDGYVDRADPDCLLSGTEDGAISAGPCNDGVDNDGDGTMDADDLYCGDAFDSIEGEAPTNANPCKDNVDNDGDGWYDSDDPDCGVYGDEVGSGAADCNDGVDNDGDSLIDSEDPGCITGTRGETDMDDSCSDGVDNDGDGWSDLKDPDCVLGAIEDDTFFGLYGCNDGINNDDIERDENGDPVLDEDGLEIPEDPVEIDQEDGDCKSAFQGVEGPSVSGGCSNGLDDDGDGWLDADDPDCFDGGKIERYFNGSVCNDGLDNDGDGDVDADDAGCLTASRFTEQDLTGSSNCEDGIDNDGDSWIDLEDEGCLRGNNEASGDDAVCADGVDNDGDGFTDRDDVDCLSGLDTDETTSDSCGDGVDNDGDGWTDAYDADCDRFGYERGFSTAACSDGLDNDGDGDVDSADSDCLTAAGKFEFPDQCADSLDNDGDGYVDTLDPDCNLFSDGFEDGRYTGSECNNGSDDDGDGESDADDADCTGALDNLEAELIAGEPVLIPYDNGDWVAEQSADEDGYSIYYLNAGSYQLNPSNEDDFWPLPQDWLSGYTAARYAADDFTITSIDFLYMDASAFENNDVFFQDFALEGQAQADSWAEQAYTWAQMDPDMYGDFAYKTEDNTWRRLDTNPTGLDNWLERTDSWVRIADGATFEEGSAVKGDFQLVLTAVDNASYMVIQGSFDVPKLKKDKWAYGSLEDELIERNGTVICGE